MAALLFRLRENVSHIGSFVTYYITQFTIICKWLVIVIKGAVTKQPLKFKKLLVDYMKSTNNFFVFLSKKGPEGPLSLV